MAALRFFSIRATSANMCNGDESFDLFDGGCDEFSIDEDDFWILKTKNGTMVGRFDPFWVVGEASLISQVQSQRDVSHHEKNQQRYDG